MKQILIDLLSGILCDASWSNDRTRGVLAVCLSDRAIAGRALHAC